MTVRAWQLGGLIFFGYVLVVAGGLRGLSRRARLQVAAGAAIGAALLAASTRLAADGLANVWIVPPAALLIGYWTSGLLFVSPMPRAERLLVRLDEALRIDAIAAAVLDPRRIPRARVTVYPLIPVALYLALRKG
jgi:hypothetical protein